MVSDSRTVAGSSLTATENIYVYVQPERVAEEGVAIG